MGKPGWSHVQSPLPEHIGQLEGTWGSETSQYPQEEKTTVIPLVVASERGTGQWSSVKKPKDLERSAAAGDSPVGVAWHWILE